ncbi:hypothetical protein JQ581_22210 [Bradyrhizobium liaoningense]|uniref:hypothetical protein n=1 Tax=Bradyrhizobium liaoningense TaxID=43992 RepID=UPI001BA6A655|nr:hypothetical protein [Bradyrhizobium liaoningense]MBR0739651.1 hypothetical protein [Bradyrhizobium liaoningense]
MYGFSISDRHVFVGLTLFVALVITAYCSRRFHTLTYDGHKYPKDARSWTTPFNYILATLLYVGLALVAFAVLIKSPEILIAITSASSPKASEAISDWIKTLVEPKIRDAAMPILAAAVLAGLFAFKLSPLRFADDWVRKSLQKMASIPTKVRATINEILTASFCTTPQRLAQIDDHLSKILAHPFDRSLLNNCADDRLATLLWKTATIDCAFEEFRNAQSSFSDLYRANQAELDSLRKRFDSLFSEAENLLLLSPTNPGAAVAASIKARELKEDLKVLLDEQLIPFSCAIVQSSSNRLKRAKHIKSFGFELVEGPTDPEIYRFILEDFSMLVFFLVLIAYPLTYLVTSFLLERPADNGYLDLLLVWPAQIAAFAIASALPAIIWKLSALRQAPAAIEGPRERYRFLGLVTVALVGALFSIALMVALSLAGEFIAKGLGEKPIDQLRAKIEGVAPYGIVAAAIGVVTSALIDFRARFQARYIFDGMITGMIAATCALLAAIAQANADKAALKALISGDLERLSNSGLRTLPFVLLILFSVGFCIGLIVPRGFRRYPMGHRVKA